MGVFGRPTSDPPRTAREQIACSRSRCRNLNILPTLKPHPHACATNGQPTLLHNHARYDTKDEFIESGDSAKVMMEGKETRISRTFVHKATEKY